MTHRGHALYGIREIRKEFNSLFSNAPNIQCCRRNRFSSPHLSPGTGFFPSITISWPFFSFSSIGSFKMQSQDAKVNDFFATFIRWGKKTNGADQIVVGSIINLISHVQR